MGHKKLAKCSKHKWCSRKGCQTTYHNMLQSIPEDEEFNPKGLILIKLPPKAHEEATHESKKKRKHHTILYKCSDKYGFSKMIKLITQPGQQTTQAA